MKHAIHIEGGEINTAGVESVVRGIAAIFESASDNRINDATIEKALAILQSVGGVQGVGIHGCDFRSGQ